MAITIRNKTTEDLIRKIGSRTGEGPSAVVRRLTENEVRQHDDGTVSKAEVQRKTELLKALSAAYRPPDPKPRWGEIQAEVDSIYAYLDDAGPPDPKLK